MLWSKDRGRPVSARSTHCKIDGCDPGSPTASRGGKQAARAAFDIDPGAVCFQYPPRVELGDLALTAPFDLAKTLRRKPREIAERLAGELTSSTDVLRAEVAGGGYLNLFLHRGSFAAGLVYGFDLLEGHGAAGNIHFPAVAIFIIFAFPDQFSLES
jgi:hypothetical protein